MIHTTWSNIPNLKRYVGPDDGLLGKTNTTIIGISHVQMADKYVFMLLSES